jgi:hypothetical protein
LVRNINRLVRWSPAALIYKGLGGLSDGDFGEFDLIHLRPLSFVRQDGTVDDPDLDWLLRG